MDTGNEAAATAEAEMLRTQSTFQHGDAASMEPTYGDAQLAESSSEGEDDDESNNHLYMSLGAQYGMEFKLARKQKERASMNAILNRHKMNHSFGAGDDHINGVSLGPARHSMGHEMGDYARMDRVSNYSAVSTVRQSMCMMPVMESLPERDGSDDILEDFDGWMHKKGQRFKSWKLRYFQLSQKEIKYSTEPGGKHKGGGVVLGVEYLKSVPFGLTIRLAPNRALYVYAESTDEQTRGPTVQLQARYSRSSWASPVDSLPEPIHVPIELPHVQYEPPPAQCTSPEGQFEPPQVQYELLQVQYEPPQVQPQGVDASCSDASPQDEEDAPAAVDDASRDDAVMPQKQSITLGSMPQVSSNVSSTSSERRMSHARSSAVHRLSQISNHSGSIRLGGNDADAMVEGWLFKQGRIVKSWKQRYFRLLDHTLSYRETPASTHLLGHGRVVGVERSNTTHTFGLTISLDGNRTLHVYAENEIEMRKWLRALTALVQAIPRTTGETLFKQSRTHGAFLKNFSGWMSIPSGLFNASLKRCFFTLHGAELTQSDDAPALVTRTDTIHHVVAWSGKPNGLEFHMRSNKVWKTVCPSQSAAAAWLAAINDNLKRQDFTVERFLKRCVVKELPTIMCGWATQINNTPRGKGIRQFYVFDTLHLSVACDVDAIVQPIDVITRVTPSSVDCAFEVHFVSEPMLVLQCDSVDGLRNWHLVIRTCLKEPIRQSFRCP
ncbi:hypothetical protein SPRG_07505 [Saprolegnia parasitica CBS 223.65]|uniref:PH domain-containing protein n=1 Tax=Saprolegnia parasitica (strain CBS 223.65) TaxID=695850 RepID=A0A067CL45_SAPPC|nr:hypothetical protein SPRG_07505 [Saprolegnia parasitica CBS 223.65]KDO27256.1 hypothetical protein SPRG_07505 [Saprolegnia parasitica CBS 223.65]|eukprot:XP_012202033.1 hypothetical protein SPRG_07505 [Saprolegnia parasitica CBS 223.65]